MSAGTAISRERVRIKLPHTAARRGQPCWVKLIRALHRRPWGCFEIEGDLYRPGEFIRGQGRGRLLAVEFAGIAKPGWGHRRSLYLHILWQWDYHSNEWLELGRTAAEGAEWTAVLGPIAEAALRPPALLVDPRASAQRVVAALEGELGGMERKARRLVLLAVYDQVAARVVED